MKATKVKELEFKYIKAYGRHPYEEYENYLSNGGKVIPYEEFLEKLCESKSGWKDSAAPFLKIIEEENKGLSFEKMVKNRFNEGAKKLYDSVHGDSAGEFRSFKGFKNWLKREMELSYGTEIKKINGGKPYSETNCLLSGDLTALIKPMNSKLHVDLGRMYYTRKYSCGNMVDDRWRNVFYFVSWVYRNNAVIPENASFAIIDRSKPFGPDNCSLRSTHVILDDFDAEEKRLAAKLEIISRRFNKSLLNKYYRLAEVGDIDRSVWTVKEYMKWVIQQYMDGNFAPYLNRIDKSKPYGPNNCYYSYRCRNMLTHGMSKTKLYSKWIYLNTRYKTEFKGQYTLEEFIDKALRERNFRLNSKMKVHYNDPLSMDDIEFYESFDGCEDIIRIYSVYRENVYGRPTSFKDFNEFMEWTIRSGYTPAMDFKQVVPGFVSPETCVWDIFTDMGYLKNHGKMVWKIFNQYKDDQKMVS